MSIENYDLGTIFSAFATMLVIGIVVKTYLKWNAKNSSNLQEPDWLKKRRRD